MLVGAAAVTALTVGGPGPASASTAPAAVQSCVGYPDWVANQPYKKGDVVRYADNGEFYQALYDNPGYNPTISTFYWAPFTCGTVCSGYPDWVANQPYKKGDIVRYADNGEFYQALYDNPGYNPTISTFYWKQVDCGA